MSIQTAGNFTKDFLKKVASYALFALAIAIGVLLAFVTPQEKSKHSFTLSIGGEAMADAPSSGTAATSGTSVGGGCGSGHEGGGTSTAGTGTGTS
jgi:hypothetical protein